MRGLLALLIFSFVAGISWSQSSQNQYLTAKNLFNESRYDEAIPVFAGLAADPTFGPYAFFYHGLSLCKDEKFSEAIGVWNQLLSQHPGFDQKEEVHYWMSRAYFENYDTYNGIQYAERLDSRTQENLYKEFLADDSFEQLATLFSEFEDNRELAKILIRVGQDAGLSQTDQFLIDGITDRMNIPKSELSGFPKVYKDSYSVAVFLPFLFDGLENTDRVLRNELVTDLFQGMELAVDLLREDSISIVLSPYDTKRDVQVTRALINNSDLNHVDAIVGPLYPGPVEVISNYSREQAINLINPVSGNLGLFKDNPYGFILKPSYRTAAIQAARYMHATSSKPEVGIYYEDKEPEKIIAKAYREEIENLGMKLSEYSTIDNKTARQVLSKFSNLKEVVLNITAEEAQNLKEKGRLIRERKVFNASGELLKNEDGTPRIQYYEMAFTADTKTLDHMFAVTKSNLLANNFVGAIESISDTVRLLGLGQWLDFSMLDYRQLERLNVQLIDTNFKNRKSPFFERVQEAYEHKYGKSVSDFGLFGFESIWWMGHMLHHYGKYFQNGLLEENDFPTLFYGHKYSLDQNDNQVVPIIQFREEELKAINLINEEGEK